ncbi:MAG: chemotaxis protein CheX [Acidobacteriota bacterium]
MSSTICQRRTPTFAEHRPALQEALVNVSQESFFAFAELCGIDRFGDALAAVEAQSEGAAKRWLRSRVDFDGAFAGTVELTLPHALATELLMSFTGLTPEDGLTDVHVYDGIGEFANMVCGTWLTHACAHRRFDLQPPVVTAVAAPVTRAADGQEELVLVNDQPVSLRVEFRAS